MTLRIQLIELTGRCIREDKAGYIEAEQPALLMRLNISPKNWLTLSKGFRKLFHGAIGHSDTKYCILLIRFLYLFCQNKNQTNINLSNFIFLLLVHRCIRIWYHGFY